MRWFYILIRNMLQSTSWNHLVYHLLNHSVESTAQPTSQDFFNSRIVFLQKIWDMWVSGCSFSKHVPLQGVLMHCNCSERSFSSMNMNWCYWSLVRNNLKHHWSKIKRTEMNAKGKNESLNRKQERLEIHPIPTSQPCDASTWAERLHRWTDGAISWNLVCQVI